MSARALVIALVGAGCITAAGVGGFLATRLNQTTSAQSPFDTTTAVEVPPPAPAPVEAAKPVGDVCARFFDEDGNPVRGAVEDRVLAISLEDLRRIPTVVGLAAGVEKARGVLGALRGRYVDALICDAPLAEALLASA